MFSKAIALFAVIQSFEVVLSVCNGVEITSGLTLPPNQCSATSFDGVEQSLKFVCGSTPTGYVYDNMDCSGTAVNITTEFGNSTIVCDGEDCPVVVITIHQGRNDSCDATGDYVVSPLAIGCADLDAETSFDVECAGSGTLTQSLYSNADCSGDPTTIIEQNTGCQDGEYITFTCAASNKFIGITIIIAVLLALCSF